jgi:hypothetical protein
MGKGECMNLFNTGLRILVVASGILLGAQPAAADPIGPDCDTCQGAIYRLESFLLDDNTTQDLYAIRLTMNTAGLTTELDAAVAVDSVAVKTTAQSDAWVGGFNLFSAPEELASWNQLAGGLSAGGCKGSGSNGFFCEDWVGAGVGAPVGGTLVFLWTGLVDPSDLKTGLLDASIKARFVNANGEKTGDLLSEGITLQPGPLGVDPRSVPELSESITLFSLGFIGLAVLRRRYRQTHYD